MWAKLVKTSKKLRKNKRLQQKLAFVRNNIAMVSFVFIFAVIGVYALSRSLAATGNDLVVTSISMSPATPLSGQAVTFSAVVKNQGSTATTAGTVVGVGFYVDGVRVTWNEATTASLAAGSSVTLTANAGTAGATWAATTGPHTVQARADDTNAIPDEIDEGNNTKDLAFTVGSTGNMYVSPATSSVLINGTLVLDIRLTPGTTVDGATATLTYDQTKLQYVSIDSSTSPFDQALGPPTGGGGTVNVTRGNLNGGVSADASIAQVTFKALVGSGSTSVTLAGNATKNGGYTNPSTANATVNFTAPDTTPPVTAITAPTANTTWLTTQTVTATATDAVGVTKVELYIDGVLKGTDTVSPYTFSVDTTTLTNAVHSLQTKAYDAAGNVGSSATVSVTVKNWKEDINQNGTVDLQDFSILASNFGKSGAAITNPRADINGNGTVDLPDFSLLASKFGQ